MERNADSPYIKLKLGKQDKIKAYLLLGGQDSGQRKELRRPGEYVGDGFKGNENRFHHEDVREDIKVVEAVRGAIGDKMEIMVDGQPGMENAMGCGAYLDLKKAVKGGQGIGEAGEYTGWRSRFTMRITTIWPA